MKILPLALILGAFALAACSKSSAPETTAATVPAKGELIAVTAKDADWVAAEKAKYPITVCTVSGDKLGSMGTPPAYIWREPGKADRLVLFCCSDCPPDFMKEPAKFLAKIK